MGRLSEPSTAVRDLVRDCCCSHAWVGCIDVSLLQHGLDDFPEVNHARPAGDLVGEFLRALDGVTDREHRFAVSSGIERLGPQQYRTRDVAPPHRPVASMLYRLWYTAPVQLRRSTDVSELAGVLSRSLGLRGTGRNFPNCGLIQLTSNESVSRSLTSVGCVAVIAMTRAPYSSVTMSSRRWIAPHQSFRRACGSSRMMILDSRLGSFRPCRFVGPARLSNSYLNVVRTVPSRHASPSIEAVSSSSVAAVSPAS